MPLLEYQCQACGQRTERLSWGHEHDPLVCRCGSPKLDRVWYSRVALAAKEGGGDSDFDSGDGGETCSEGGCGEGQCCGGGMCEA